MAAFVERVQAIILIPFERVPRSLRDSFVKSHARVNITRVIKETTNLGKVSYEVHFVDALGQAHQHLLIDSHKRGWRTR